jgi:hypothetical protein
MGISAEEFLDRYTLDERTFPFALRSEPGERLERARQAVDVLQLRSRLQPDDASLQAELARKLAELDDAQAEVESVTYPVRIRSLPRPEWAALKDEHPPTDAQIRKAQRKGGPAAAPEWNEDSFPPAAIAACVVDPDFDLDAAKRFWHDGTEGDTWSLFVEISRINGQKRTAALGKGSEPTQD